MAFALYGQTYFTQVPFVVRPWAPAAQLIGILLTEFPAPLADSFIGHEDPENEQQIFDIAVVEAEGAVQPYAMADDFSWETVICVRIGCCRGMHNSSQDGLSAGGKHTPPSRSCMQRTSMSRHAEAVHKGAAKLLHILF
jgi:hypothetical protein